MTGFDNFGFSLKRCCVFSLLCFFVLGSQADVKSYSESGFVQHAHTFWSQTGTQLDRRSAGSNKEWSASIDGNDFYFASEGEKTLWVGTAITSQASTLATYASLELLQREVNIHLHLFLSPSNVSEILPVYYLHFAKCNNGFLRSIMFLPGFCNLSERVQQLLTDPDREHLTMEWYPEEECPRGVEDLRDTGIFYAAHSGIGRIYEQHVRGHGMVILRQPEQRLLSAWYDNQHSWPQALYGRLADNISEFASVLGGCMTKMMTRDQVSKFGGHTYEQGLSACGDPVVPSAEESALAMSHLREGFIFVGILEEYDLSVCLLHKMYGGECSGIELITTHEGSSSSSSEYDTSILNGWVDAVDRAFYAQGQRIFQENLKLHGVNEDACQPCWAAAAA